MPMDVKLAYFLIHSSLVMRKPFFYKSHLPLDRHSWLHTESVELGFVMLLVRTFFIKPLAC